MYNFKGQRIGSSRIRSIYADENGVYVNLFFGSKKTKNEQIKKVQRQYEPESRIDETIYSSLLYYTKQFFINMYHPSIQAEENVHNANRGLHTV